MPTAIAELLHYLVRTAVGLSEVNRQEFHDAIDRETVTATPPDELLREPLPEDDEHGPTGQGSFTPEEKAAEIEALEARLFELRAG